jgi:virginiamycin B lyase
VLLIAILAATLFAHFRSPTQPVTPHPTATAKTATPNPAAANYEAREFPLPTANSNPNGITAGPDGALWFTEMGAIGRITTDGQIRDFPFTNLPDNGAGNLVVGADHALWFSVNTPANYNEIWRITTDGQISKFAPKSTNHVIFGMALGPDGAIWYTEPANNLVGRLTVGQ